jgi:hypothetical protein
MTVTTVGIQMEPSDAATLVVGEWVPSGHCCARGPQGHNLVGEQDCRAQLDGSSKQAPLRTACGRRAIAPTWISL